jgi:septal ring factor EnvC (AmiA/AmiB activator)
MVKNIGSLLTLILSGVSFAGIMTKFLHKRYDRMFDEHLEEIRKNDKKQAEEITEIKDTLNNLATKVDSLETKVDSLEKRFEKRFNVVEDFNAEICRNAIKDIYYKYNKTQKIPLYERKMADSLYKIYSEQFHQNSYGQLLYQEICKWEIDPTDKLTM